MSEQNSFLDQYVQADDSVLYHDNDPALTPIRLSLPRPPSLKLIDGYGLPAKEQKFRRNIYPEKLKRLEELSLQAIKDKAEKDKQYTATVYKVQEEFWKTLNGNREYYQEEIAWAKKTWWHCLNGYWFFCKGKPTYISPWHYFYLNFWLIDGAVIPEYRDRDRREFLFFHYSYTATETFANLDKNGVAIPNDDGTYEMVDIGKRICFGVGQNKNRRSGNTNKGLNVVYLMTITHRGTSGGGIMSMSGDSAEEHMNKKVLPCWRKMPLVFKGITSSSTNPSSIVHLAPSSQIGVDCLENAITAAGTSDSTFFDGKKLWVILIDESGKSKTIDVTERHEVLKHCVSLGDGSDIFGWEYQPSTAEEMSKGGESYKNLLDSSYFYKRDAVTGQTQSGLFRLFIPADEGLEKYIDEYGASVKGTKLSKDHAAMGFRATSTQALMSKRNQLLADSKTNPKSMVLYRMAKKQYPITYDDSWIGNAGDIGFDMEILDKQIAEVSRMDMPTQRGNFRWSGAKYTSQSIWVPDELNGKFYISLVLPQKETNQKIKDYYFDQNSGDEVLTYRPKSSDRFTCGVDPFQSRGKTQAMISNTKLTNHTGRLSNGGIAVFWHRDYSIDPEGKNASELKSNRFVCTYSHRETDSDLFIEDVLLCCLYYNAMCFPENNIPIVSKAFNDLGFGGFLKYQVDEKGKIKEYAGVQSLERSKQEGFLLLRDHIAIHGRREVHENLLMEWKSIGGIEEMTKYDLLAASMCALIGSKSEYSKMVDEENETNYDLSSIYNRY